MYLKSQKQLEQVEKEAAELKEKLAEAREAWAKALGDADLATKSAEEMQKKQKKRWAELTGVSHDDAEAADATAAEEAAKIDLPLNIEVTEQARKIAELEHKLKQALENVRQADTVRQSLKEALLMNNTLTTKLDEVKTKYAALQASRSNSSSANKSSSSENQGSSSRDKSISSSDKIDPSKAEKLHREHRRMRKELAALTASKDAAKSKLEVSVATVDIKGNIFFNNLHFSLSLFLAWSIQRAEKEREMLTETNTRLLKQSTEKDDMNARSLSTILHLKTLTEQLTQEKISLEQQLKSAGQLALAARLATNAKDRVAEEVVKEKEVRRDNVDYLLEIVLCFILFLTGKPMYFDYYRL